MADDRGLYARSFTDVYDDWYGDLDDPSHLVGAIASRHQVGAHIVELGSGTGRLALPLTQSGFRVTAIDISLPMLANAAPGPAAVLADMAELPMRTASADAVIIAYNTLFNAPTRAMQQRCFDEAARVLRPHGTLAIEAFVAPTATASEFGLSRRSHPCDSQAMLTIVTGPHATQDDVIVGSHIESGISQTCRPWQLVYQTPTQLDACALRAALALEARTSSWAGADFDDECHRHVSWYKLI